MAGLLDYDGRAKKMSKGIKGCIIHFKLKGLWLFCVTFGRVPNSSKEAPLT